MSDELLDRVTKEIVDIHDFFTEWVQGTCPNDDATYDKGLLSRLSKNAVVAMPAGKAFPYEMFTMGMKEDYGSNPKFKIAIRDVKIRHKVGEVVVFTYTEWHKDSAQSTPKDNGRFATCIFRDRGSDFEILHVHETWLPEDQQKAGPYDF